MLVNRIAQLSIDNTNHSMKKRKRTHHYKHTQREQRGTKFIRITSTVKATTSHSPTTSITPSTVSPLTIPSAPPPSPPPSPSHPPLYPSLTSNNIIHHYTPSLPVIHEPLSQVKPSAPPLPEEYPVPPHAIFYEPYNCTTTFESPAHLARSYIPHIKGSIPYIRPPPYSPDIPYSPNSPYSRPAPYSPSYLLSM